MKIINFEIKLTDTEYRKIINPIFFDDDNNYLTLISKADGFTLELEIRPHKKNNKIFDIIANVQKAGEGNNDLSAYFFSIAHIDNFLKRYHFTDSKNNLNFSFNLNIDVNEMIANLSKKEIKNFIDIYENRYLSVLNFIENQIDFNKEILDFILSADITNDFSLISFAITMNNCLIYLNDDTLNLLIEKLAYFGYDEESISSDNKIEDFESCKNCTLTFLLRNIYNNFDGVDKDDYLTEFLPLFSNKEVEEFFKVFTTSYLREVMKLNI